MELASAWVRRGPVQEGEEREGGDRKDCWKTGRERSRLHTWPRVGLADEAGSDDIPDAAGGEGCHGTARSDRVIHRYIYPYDGERIFDFDRISFRCVLYRLLKFALTDSPPKGLSRWNTLHSGSNDLPNPHAQLFY